MFLTFPLRNSTVAVCTVFLLIFCCFGGYFWKLSTKTTLASTNENANHILKTTLQQIFDDKNKALLKADKEALAVLYNKNVRNGLWAYENELIKLNYLQNWSAKQSVEFKIINSHVVLKNAKKKESGYEVSLLVSTEYKYVYKDTPLEYNAFRIGTSHTLALIPHNGKWLITKDWYGDPLAKSFHIDEEKGAKVMKEFIQLAAAKRPVSLKENRIKVVNYADQYCGTANLPQLGMKYNQEYLDYAPQGGDCTNFVSQALYAGGSFRKNNIWNYQRGEGSKAWINAHAFNNYMIHSGRASIIARGSYDQVLKPSYKLLPGDYIAYEKKGRVAHTSIVTGMDSKGFPLVNSHDADRYRVPWDLGWNSKGIVFCLIHVHY